ncbi:MAG TPA: CbiQ family ECF transporter T component [Vicinamibacteria bacterium]|nr:CbiQ family ECF transporter T component [Vicinamibacteria bacterium]
MSAEVRLAAAVALVVVTALLPLTATWYFAAVAALLGLTTLLARVPVRTLFRRLLLVEPFAIGTAMLAWWQPDGGRIFLGLLVKSTLCVATMVLLAVTTPFTALVDVLRRARVPPLLVTTLALLDRYRFVLADEALRMRRARASRSFDTRRGLSWATLASVVAVLFLRSTERAERIYAAMCARGWR